MNPILQWLSADDLRSDGLANEVAGIVIQQPHLISDLIEGLDHPNDAVRGHTADALEKIARSQPELLRIHLPKLLACSRRDPVPMVKMHLAMIFGHLALYEEQLEDLLSALLVLLHDNSVFASSWAIASLCILARKYPDQRDGILQEIVALQRHDSVAIRTRVKKAIHLLTHENALFPNGWIKSEHLQSLS